jgi:hypothetical protein
VLLVGSEVGCGGQRRPPEARANSFVYAPDRQGQALSTRIASRSVSSIPDWTQAGHDRFPPDPSNAVGNDKMPTRRASAASQRLFDGAEVVLPVADAGAAPDVGPANDEVPV